MNPTIRAVEPAACPSLTKGVYRLRLRRHRRDDAAGEDAHAGPRLRARPDPRRRPALPRHGAAGVAPLRAGPDRGDRHPPDRVLRRGLQFARTEGILPAPEPTHAIAAAIREAQGVLGRPARRRSSSPRCAATATSTWRPTRRTSPASLVDYEYPEEKVHAALEQLPIMN